MTTAIIMLMVSGSARAEFDHGPWGQLLERHVKVLDERSTTQVDYAGMAADHEQLTAYLDQLAAVSQAQFDGWTEPDRLAFLINVYNAWTVDYILTDYPDLDSIRDLGSLFRSAWSRPVVDLFGEQVTLDHVEHELIRGPDGYGEPRIHFAVNCASVGCPALRWEPYIGDRLEEQLESATRLFLADRSRNRLDGNTLRVSQIFNWYEEDFEQGWRGTDTVGQFLARYTDSLDLPDNVVDELESGDFRIRFLSYDWSLNNAR